MSATASLRAAARVAARSSMRARVPTLRRGLASSAGEHAPKKSNDMPWIIASAAVFGSSFVYLVGPGAKKTSEHAHHRQGDGLDAKGEHAPRQQSAPEPERDEQKESKDSGSEGGMKDSEGNEASAQEIKDSIQRGEKSDAPKQAYGAEQKGQSGNSGSGGGLPTEDAEGKKVDPKEVAESAQKGLNEDSPKDAKKAEEAKSRK
ncbi:hypothetical protein AURDEDRAFT_112208 [Auricularia subglabra TFB-10046 SS5]|nr:hypothetical protein AURDEDRAFT_112208 [Auricularia subglabra TFB-10046 SS5]